MLICIHTRKARFRFLHTTEKTKYNNEKRQKFTRLSYKYIYKERINKKKTAYEHREREQEYIGEKDLERSTSQSRGKKRGWRSLGTLAWSVSQPIYVYLTKKPASSRAAIQRNRNRQKEEDDDDDDYVRRVRLVELRGRDWVAGERKLPHSIGVALKDGWGRGGERCARRLYIYIYNTMVRGGSNFTLLFFTRG